MTGMTSMMGHHRMVTAMVQVASMEISLGTDTIPLERTIKMVMNMFHAGAAMMTDNQHAGVRRMTAKNVAALVITKMAKTKVTMNGQMITANAHATASVSVTS